MASWLPLFFLGPYHDGVSSLFECNPIAQSEAFATLTAFFFFQAQVDQEVRERKNLETLRRLDPEVTEVLGSATHVAIYQVSKSDADCCAAGTMDTVAPPPLRYLYSYHI